MIKILSGKENIGEYWGKYVKIVTNDEKTIKGFVTLFDSKEFTKEHEDKLYLQNREFEDFIKLVFASNIACIKEITQDAFYKELEANLGIKNAKLDRDELEWDLIIGMSSKKLVMKDYVDKYIRVHCLYYGVVSGYIVKYDENYIDFTQEPEDQVVEPALIMEFLNGDKMVLEESCIDAIVVIDKSGVNDKREQCLINMMQGLLDFNYVIDILNKFYNLNKL